MITLQQVEDLIKQGIPGAQVQVNDLKGTGDHLEAIVVSDEFEGKSLVKQHQLVFSTLRDHLDSGIIHALALQTYTVAKWNQQHS
ncbi:MAG: BolA/IbaG family iron-sulfur metabolism protein [Synechococcaceae cyanobacterium RL_1_2]|jgi:acid stress-induced BolA-like protein IbaG/YrbA|nr:BolA/IbaG family iron-sulfur metabolism protein [Synechococcaceae cyanobacterium RL_1_2]